MGDLQAAQKFYGDVLGIATSENNGLMTLHLADGRDPAGNILAVLREASPS